MRIFEQKGGSPATGANACFATLRPIEEYKATYPNKEFDYMAVGRPVILAIEGVIRQVVEDADGGIFAQPGDPVALADVIQNNAADKEKARRMGLAGRMYLKNYFSRSRITAQLPTVIEGLEK